MKAEHDAIFTEAKRRQGECEKDILALRKEKDEFGGTKNAF